MMIFAFGWDSHLSDQGALKCNSESYKKNRKCVGKSNREIIFLYCSLMFCMTEWCMTEWCMTEWCMTEIVHGWMVHDWNHYAQHTWETEGI